MTEQSYFFNNVNGDREYDAETFALYFKKFLSSGVYHQNNQPALKVIARSGLNSELETGSAFLEGFMYQNTENITLTHDPSDATNPRIDRVILRLDRNVNVRAINAMIKKGTPSTNPVPPSLQRDDFTFEVSLAQVRIDARKNSITSIKDERYDSSVCGIVSSLISIPTDDFEEQFNEWFLGIQNQIGARLFYGEPTEPIAGDVWLKTV